MGPIDFVRRVPNGSAITTIFCAIVAGLGPAQGIKGVFLSSGAAKTRGFQTTHNLMGLDSQTFGCCSGGKSESQATMKSRPFNLACFQRWTKRSER